MLNLKGTQMHLRCPLSNDKIRTYEYMLYKRRQMV